MRNYSIAVTMPTTSGRKKTKTFYPGTAINYSSFYSQYFYKGKHVSNKVGDRNIILEEIYACEETSDYINLKKGKLYYNVLEDDNISFEEEWLYTLSFNKTKNIVEDKDIFKKMEIETTLDTESLFQIIEYINKIVNTNDNVLNFFRNNPDILFKGKLSLNKDVIDTIISVMYNVSYSLLEIEKMVNAGQEKLLIKNFNNRDFRLEQNTKKLSQSVGLPPFALPIIKKLRIENCIESLSKINSIVDGNSLKILLEFVDNYSNFLTLKLLGTSQERAKMLNNFFENLYTIISSGYKMQDTLNYILRQRMYWNKDNPFGFPFEDTKLFLDYLELSKNNSLKCEKYPQNLKRMHDVLVQNLNSYDPKKDKEFKDAVSKYSKYENELTKDGYVFIVPTNIKALIQEGNDLHHCIGSYVDRIIEGKSRIFFMREISSKNVSFVTVEIDEDCNILEIKGMFNQEPDAKIISIAKKWAGICKRIK